MRYLYRLLLGSSRSHQAPVLFVDRVSEAPVSFVTGVMKV